MEIKLFAATKAFIKNREGNILILKESTKYQDGSNAGKFDVVGGRVKPGERFDESLLREIKEETGLDVRINKPFFISEWRPAIRGEQWQIVATFIECETDSSEVALSDDHDRFEWIKPSEYRKYDIIENLSDAFEAYIKK